GVVPARSPRRELPSSRWGIPSPRSSGLPRAGPGCARSRLAPRGRGPVRYMTAFPNLERLPRMLAAQRRRRALGSALRALFALLAIHLAILAVLASLSVRNPLAPGWLAAMGWSFLIYLLVP